MIEVREALVSSLESLQSLLLRLGEPEGLSRLRRGFLGRAPAQMRHLTSSAWWAAALDLIAAAQPGTTKAALLDELWPEPDITPGRKQALKELLIFYP